MRRRPVPFLAAAFVALSLPALALAQEKPATPPVTIYGTLNVNLQNTSAKGATAAGADVQTRYALSTDSTNIGVRGGLDVNQWVGATYQCETSAAVSGTGVSGICNRNSRIGVKGDWGTLWYGNWDTPFKAAIYGTKVDDPFMATDVYGYAGIMGSPGFNYKSSAYAQASDTTTIGFDIRANNSVGYWSPKWNGLGVKLQWVANHFMNATGSKSPTLVSGVVNYDSQTFGSGDLKAAFSVLGSYERHDDGFSLAGINPVATVAAPGAFGATAANNTGTATSATSSVDTAWRVGAGVQLDWSAGATTVSALFEQLDLQQGEAAAGAITEYKRSAWQLALKHRIAEHELRLRYSQADKGDVTLNGGGGSTTGYGATMLAVGYAYFFAPTFQVYAYYAQITNDDQGQYTFNTGGAPAVAGATPKGADPLAVGLGIRYAF